MNKITLLSLIGFVFGLGVMNAQAAKKTELTTFAGGCFWCIESSLQKVPGVKSAVSGYMGGKKEDATYKKVSKGTTGHIEVVQLEFDPSVISFTELLQKFWVLIDPTDAEGSFYDKGEQYTSAIFYHNEEQKAITEKMIAEINASGRFSKPVVTKVRPMEPFYEAETYHQDYFLKKPDHYYRYRVGSGRDQLSARVWGSAPFADEKTYKKPDEKTSKRKAHGASISGHTT